MKNFFPLGLALGESFCNRVIEKKRLRNNIKTSTPTLVSSPRRFGKTSLVVDTLEQEGVMYVHIDLFSATSIDDVLSSTLNGVGKAISLVQPNLQKAAEIALELFSNIQINVAFGKAGINIGFNRGIQNPVDEINNALDKLETLLKKYNKKLVLFFDEFQVVGQIQSNISVEAVTRAHVQVPSNITYIFSGSNRHLLSQMFDDRKRPFYKLCDRLIIDKISVEAYSKFLKHAAMETWKKEIEQSTIDRIFTLTDRHPFYLNALCFKVWQNEKLPSTEKIDECWLQLAEEQKPQIALEIELLSLNQRKIISCIAKWGKTSPMQSKEFVQFSGMASSSLHQALQSMTKKDFIEAQNDGSYKIIDPMIEYLFK